MTTPKHIPLSILEEITNRFSVDSRIGMGGYADVYKGFYEGRDIAVKWLHVNMLLGHNNQLFINEVGNHFRAEHRNIVQFVGYCYETKNIYVDHEGEGNFRKHIYKVICSEYLQGGSLHKRLYDKSFAPDWTTRYNIIKGVCEGVNYLHNSVPQILHLDLKPANILLTSSMEPKLADLGLSRLFTPSHTHVTKNIIGTPKYMPPEFISGGEISPQNDIYSLGVIMIAIMTDSVGYSNFLEMDDVAQLTQQVFTNWSTAIGATSKYPMDEKHQLQTCIKLAIRCVDSNRKNRPSATDIVDALNKTETNIPKKQFADELPCPTVGPSSTESDTLEMMINELETIANTDKHYNNSPRDNNVQQVPEIRETTAFLEEEFIIGRTEEKQKILSALSRSMTKKMVILPIYGIGGIGKTTLAQLVFGDTYFQDYSRVWIYVSQKFDLNKIGNSIVSQLGNEDRHIAGMHTLYSRLGDLLSGKRVLIVLDDLWEKEECNLDELKVMLRLGQGSKVIVVTTRDEAIAVEICEHATPYKLEILSDDMCWKIIKQKSAFKCRVDKKQLKYIGRDIAAKCGGVALAAQSLGYMLRKMKRSDQWESVRDNCIWNLSTRKDPSSQLHKVLASLLLSYSHMPDWLKLCFSYCGVFPKGHHMVMPDLIHQWIALGFTEESDMFDPMQLCEEYLTQLLGMSFLQYSKAQPSLSGSFAKYHAATKLESDGYRGMALTMHDLVHDLARAILAHQVYDKGNAGGDRCRYALVTDCSKTLQLSVTSHANIRALHFLDCGKLKLCGDIFSLAMCLRILDLSGCILLELPNSIGHLKQLKYLHAPSLGHETIVNCISELSKLNYLNLEWSHIQELPERSGDMKGLMHLDLSGCYRIHRLPISFTELKQLVHLDLAHCPVYISKAFGGFTNLQYLNLSVPDDLTKSRSWQPEVIGNLIKLRYLNISRCLRGENLPGRQSILFESIRKLTNLEHLNLSWNEELSSIPESIGNLRKLHTLDLSGCFNLEKLPDSMVKMVSLKVVNVNMCDKLNPSENYKLPFATFIRFMVSCDECSSNIILLQPSNPVVLTIDGLEKVKSAEEAQSIKLIEKQGIKDLTFQWTVDAGRFVDDKEVLEKLVPPISVDILHIGGYISANIPDWLMGIRNYMPNLSKIDLCDFPKCNNLPLQLGQLPNLKLLSLCRMNDLEELNTAYNRGEEGENELLFPKLEKLTIIHCAKLMIKPCLPANVTFIEILDCDNVISSPGGSLSHRGASSSSPLISLIVEKSNEPFNEWKLLHQLPALRSLSISHCRDLAASPEIIQHLSSLQSLTLKHNHQAELPSWLFELTSLQALILYDCRSMASLPPCLGKLTSLERFEISYCEGINSLPDSILQLTKLKHLRIDCCPGLKMWCESSENKMKLSHIREKNIGPAKAYKEETFIETTNNVDTEEKIVLIDEAVPRSDSYTAASDSRVNKKRKKEMRIEDTTVWNNMTDDSDNIAAPIHGIVTDEVHPDLYSAVMDMPGFKEEELLVALSHLMDNDAQGSAYLGMQEEERESWLMNFLIKHY